MRFWDSSALVTLFLEQKSTSVTRDLYEGDPDVLAWTMTDVEMRSAMARLLREGSLSVEQFQAATRDAETFWRAVHVVSLVDPVKVRAKRLLGTHALKAADSLQLAAALAATADQPATVEFVCLDRGLASAAAKEGFVVVP
jgi:predicted nucleic acid-binding protein